MELIGELLFVVFALIAVAIAVWVTFAAVTSVCRGESPWKAFKTWLVRMIDAACGVG